MISSRRIEKESWNLVDSYNLGSIKVDVENIAKELGLEVYGHDLGDNVSGMLFIKKGRGVIGYNPNQSEVRKRFTIAHEIGHYILHRYSNEVFIDQTQYKAFYRRHNVDVKDIQQEREANKFAASLLMPRPFLENAIENIAFDLADEEEDSIKNLAGEFEVSSQAMTYRISNLGLFI